jgi:hypothetical protein
MDREKAAIIPLLCGIAAIIIGFSIPVQKVGNLSDAYGDYIGPSTPITLHSIEQASIVGNRSFFYYFQANSSGATAILMTPAQYAHYLSTNDTSQNERVLTPETGVMHLIPVESDELYIIISTPDPNTLIFFTCQIHGWEFIFWITLLPVGVLLMFVSYKTIRGRHEGLALLGILLATISMLVFEVWTLFDVLGADEKFIEQGLNLAGFLPPHTVTRLYAALGSYNTDVLALFVSLALSIPCLLCLGASINAVKGTKN